MDKKAHPNSVICPKCGKKGTRRLEKIRCGPGCRKCPHGPYYYVYHRVGNKVTKCYIGKTWPQKPEEKPVEKNVSKTNMVAVWIPKGELEKLDELVKKKLYPNHDEAFRFAVHDLLKRELEM